MAPTLQVLPANPSDLNRLMDIIITSFSDMPIEQLMENTHENLPAVAQRHLHAWTSHLAAGNSFPMGYKCILRNPSPIPENQTLSAASETPPNEIIIASASWTIYTHPRPESLYSQPHFLNSGSWVADAKTRSQIHAALRPFLEARVRWMGGRPHALLMYMATDPEFRRRGAAKACVAYGVEKCRGLGIPAYLEATEAGKRLYEAMGFEVVEEIVSVSDSGVGMAFPAMVWWPEGFGVEERREVLPGFRME